MIKIINVDLDGVLANFNGKVKELTGKTFEQFSTSEEAWNALGKNLDSIYRNLDVLEGGFELMNFIQNFAYEHKYRITILSAIPTKVKIPNAEEHKRLWLQKHFGHFKNIQKRFKIGPYSKDKWKHCFTMDDILIDDYPANTRDWIDVGGKAILYTNVNKAIEELKLIGEMR